MATGLVRGHLCSSSKTGDKKKCSNNRTISLIVHASRVILKTITQRYKKNYRKEISEEQAGFVKDKGTRDQFVNIQNLMKKWKNHNIPIYLCFIDYAKTFDCVGHAQLWTIRTKMGFPMRML